MADMRERWGLPDWRDGSNYPGPDDWSMRVWGWEFLRRRDDYRDLWTAWAENARPCADGVLHAATDDPDRIRVLYGMSVLIDPRARRTDRDLWEVSYPAFGYGVGYRSQEIADLEDRAGKKAVMFDLHRPLAPQLEAARRYLSRRQSEITEASTSPKHHKDNWPTFLRVLDAKDCGAIYSEIAETLWPGRTTTEVSSGRTQKTPQSVRDLRKGARNVQRRAPFLL